MQGKIQNNCKVRSEITRMKEMLEFIRENCHAKGRAVEGV